MDFFKNLVRQRQTSITAGAKAKVYGAKARAKGKAAAKFNKAVDAPGKKLKNKAKASMSKGKEKAKKTSQKAQKPPRSNQSSGNVMTPTNKDSQRVMAHDSNDGEFDPGMKTQAIDISELVDERSQDCVGWVVCLNGSLRGKDFRLVTGRNVMGTAADCDIVLTDPYLSSKHAVIRHENGEFILIDLDSTNGSYWNEDKISKQELIDNDKVRLGRTELKFKSLF